MRNKFILFILAAFTLFGCKDYLDLVPEKDITSVESVFEKRTSTLEFLNSCYHSTRDNIGSIYRDPAICGADEFMTGNILRTIPTGSYDVGYIPSFRIAQGLNNVNEPILNTWGERPSRYRSWHANMYTSIRYCNIFIDKIDDVYNMTDDEKVQYKAEAQAMKAHYYFSLIRMYGPISLIPMNANVQDDIATVLTPRAPIDTCFKRVVDLLDEAIPNLRPFSEQIPTHYGHINKEAAYALKAKALLYQASPLFNGNSWYSGFKNVEGVELFPATYDPEKWHKAAIAADEAVEYCESAGKGLHNSSESQSSELLTTMSNIQESVISVSFENDELLWGLWTEHLEYEYRHKLPRYNPDDYDFNGKIYGDLNPTMRMVELYYTENGLPLDMDKTWSYEDRYKMGKETDSKYNNVVKLNDDVLNLHLRREPRFYANIAADKCYWKMNWYNPVMNPYKDGTHGTTHNRVMDNQYQNLTGYWVKKFVPAKVSGGSWESYAVDYPAPVMRMAELYLTQAEAWNEYQGPSSKVYDAVDKVRERAGLSKLQDAWNTYATNPGYISTKEGLREILRKEKMIEFAFEGHRFWDLRRWKIAHEHQNKPLRGWNVFGDKALTFYNNYEGPVVVWDRNEFESPRDYFWPIKDTEITVSNVKQNLGW